MDAINFIAPLEVIPSVDDKERAYQAILSRLFNGSSNVLSVNEAILLINDLPFSLVEGATQGLFNQALLDLLNYGCPHLGSPDVVERFSKQEGLVALRQSASTNALMRVMLANWQAHGSKRGLNFLTFVLEVLFPNQWQIVRLFHYVDFANQYPFFLTDIDNETTFPTSRIRITLADTINADTAVELSPSLLRLIPANIVSTIARSPIDAPIGFGLAVAAKAIHVADYSEFN